MLIGVSVVLENRLEVPGVALTPEETDGFLKAAQNVARHYAVETTQRTLDWAAFIASCVTVFGTRALTIAIAKGGQRQSRRQYTAPPSGMNGGTPVVDLQTGQPYVPSTPPGPDEYDA